VTIRRLAKRIVLWGLGREGLTVVKEQSSFGPELNIMHIALEYLRNVDGGVSIIQVGANDGKAFDPVRQFIETHKTPALLVEPLPDMAAQLRNNYEGAPGVVIENVAIGKASGRLTLYRIDSAATGMPAWAHCVASFDKSLILAHRYMPDVEKNAFVAAIVEEPVSVSTFAEVLDRHPSFRTASVLQVDTEGHDRIVVETAIEAGLKPKLINFEHRHLSFADQDGCRRYLAARGYRFASIGNDTLALSA
jgi:FkbM family methyltransferase